tara:strand:+ start:130 stop:882 length:753 start_codon:yes stop_codon:yes gene_type:complete
MIHALSLRDMQIRYAGTLGGTLWAFAHPIALVFIFYFVFAIGFRAQGPAGTPFVLWFVCGLAPWFFFAETLSAITSSITNNGHLVTKTVFPTEILPLVHLISGLFTHTIFLFVLCGMLIFFKISFSIDRLGFLYFLICNCLLLLGLGWLLSALQVFYRDIGQGLTIILTMLFWATPIVWPLHIMPLEYQSLMFYNPAYYIIEGYRGVLTSEIVVWPSALETAYFWSVTSLLLILGNYVFHRLKPEFADVI